MMNASHFQWSSAACTNTGRVRRVNEDKYLDRPERGLWAVADGMGGHMRGDLASRMIVDELDRMALAGDLTARMEHADECLLNVNEILRAEAAVRLTDVIGSTVVVLLAHEHRCGYLWVGDSRIYLYRDGRLKRLTRDHSQVEELLAKGAITEEEAATYPKRNLLTRAVGAFDTLDVDTGVIEVQDGDVFLLCSDGLTNEVSEDNIMKALADKDCRQAADMLIEMALLHGGNDNVSVVVMHVTRATAS
jgi:protein phosphatase